MVEEELDHETEVLANALMNVDKYIPPEKAKNVDVKLDLN